MSTEILFWINFTVVSGGFLLWLISCFHHLRHSELISPFAVLNFTFLTYCAVGPLYQRVNTDLNVIGIDLWESAGWASMAAVASYLCVNAGYFAFRKKTRPVIIVSRTTDSILPVAILVYAVFWITTLISVRFNLGALYNIFGVSDDEMVGASLGGLETYLYLTMSGLIAPIILLLIVPGILHSVFATLLALNAISIYVTTGFRIRVALLLLAATFALAARKTFLKSGSFPFLRVLQVGFVAICLIAVMSVARSYGQGINRDIVSAAKTSDFVGGFFKDTSIFYMGGKVIALYNEDDERKHTYFETVEATVIRAIPSKIYGTKLTPLTLVAVQDAMGGTPGAIASGFAVPFYIEYFIMFGWLGLVVFSFLLGVLCAKIQNYFGREITSYQLCAYILLSSYLFMYFHRGYLPQQVDYFFFIVVLPLLALIPFRRSLI